MTAKELIELYIHSVAPERDADSDDLDAMSSDERFMYQLRKGKPFKKDQINTRATADLNFNVDTDNSWMSAADRPWY